MNHCMNTNWIFLTCNKRNLYIIEYVQQNMISSLTGSIAFSETIKGKKKNRQQWKSCLDKNLLLGLMPVWFIWVFCYTAVASNLSHVLCLSHVGRDRSSISGAIGPFWTGAGRITVSVVIRVHAVVLIPPSCWLLLWLEGKEIKLKLKKESNTQTTQTQHTGKRQERKLTLDRMSPNSWQH